MLVDGGVGPPHKVLEANMVRQCDQPNPPEHTWQLCFG